MKIEVNGLTLDYELLGDEGAPPLVLTPGGRYPRETAGVPELGQKLAEGGYRVLLWDRPGCGASDIAFTAPSESVMNCEALVGLVEALGMKDVTLVGGSAGSRITLMAAARMPRNVRKMAIWWISGGPVGLAGLAWFYCGDQIAAASKGGMEESRRCRAGPTRPRAIPGSVTSCSRRTRTNTSPRCSAGPRPSPIPTRRPCRAWPRRTSRS
jgi:pimeloyl-ACP methyl ester carboxylesterase